MKLKTLNQIQEYLYTFRDKKNKYSQGGSNFLFKRTEYLAEKLGNPQNNVKVVHIAGTSGKGSTTRILSNLLSAQGQKVGSSISPHLIDMRERFQINNSLLPIDTISSYLEEIIPILEDMRTSEVGQPTYFEVTVMLAYYIFHKEQVDYAVMETGMGGRLDATNGATKANKLCVITRIGLDHTEFLGDTVEKIAAEKAAIIHSGNTVVALKQGEEIDNVIKKRAQECNSLVSHIIPDKTFSHIRLQSTGSLFDFHYQDLELSDFLLSLDGEYQVENTSLALGALYELSKRDGFSIDESALRSSLKTMTSPGRFETFEYNGKTIIIDGAHNPQKMTAFISSLKKMHPKKKFEFLIGFKQGKDYAKMLDIVLPLAYRIFISEFAKQDEPRVIHPEPVANIIEMIKEVNSEVPTQSFEHPLDALSAACNDTSEILIITGSLYLMSELYPTIHGTLSH